MLTPTGAIGSPLIYPMPEKEQFVFSREVYVAGQLPSGMTGKVGELGQPFH